MVANFNAFRNCGTDKTLNMLTYVCLLVIISVSGGNAEVKYPFKDVELGELPPNEDGAFQKTSTLTVTPYELKKNKYSCVVEHQSKTFMEHLTEDEIRATHGNSLPNGIIVGVVAAVVVVLLVIICCTACMVNQKKIESESSSDTTRRPKDMDQSVLFLGETMLQAF